MTECGGVVSVDAVASDRPAWMLAGCAPISANRFTVACCILWIWIGSREVEWVIVLAVQSIGPVDRAAPNTRAPLGARYIVMWCVATPAP